MAAVSRGEKIGHMIFDLERNQFILSALFIPVQPSAIPSMPYAFAESCSRPRQEPPRNASNHDPLSTRPRPTANEPCREHPQDQGHGVEFMRGVQQLVYRRGRGEIGRRGVEVRWYCILSARGAGRGRWARRGCIVCRGVGVCRGRGEVICRGMLDAAAWHAEG
ncbi:IQ domain-containing protein H [Striga asiatica]|uniref:IQ domain-containing protein H n=1 Tax=Striga asiatica TaxID=4170 RepID=A0A5A7RGS8_STRAF|nr:IQ domain-containing protein H [Striga asiatica]